MDNSLNVRFQQENYINLCSITISKCVLCKDIYCYVMQSVSVKKIYKIIVVLIHVLEFIKNYKKAPLCILLLKNSKF